MATAGIRELKQNASAVVARAAAGETIIITDRGREVAQLTPLPASVIDRMIAAGLATPPTRDWRDLPEPAPLPPGSASASEVLAAMRDEERY